MLGCLPDAVATFEALARDPGAALDLPAYNAMVHALARAGEMAAAESMLDTASRLAEAQGERLCTQALAAPASLPGPARPWV
jgi:pentatricopeptide repeat protein